MGLLEFFRNRQQKSKNTSLIAKGDSSIAPYTPKKKKIRNIVDFVENAFENRSRVSFYDTVIDKKDCKINTVVRNKIDKFTGGTISKSLFKETEISGKFHITLHTLDRIHRFQTGSEHPAPAT